MRSVSPAPITLQPVLVCGYPILPVGGSETLNHALWLLKEEKGAWVLALNLDLVSHGLRDPLFADLLKRADVMVADGYPLVWGAQKKGALPFDRATGSDLTQALLHHVEPDRTAIIGGRDPRLALRKEGLDPDAGWFIYDGLASFDDAWVQDLAEKIRGRNLVFVALGVPKQEKLIALLRPVMPTAVFVGVGGSFEFLAGLNSRAPVWMQRRGLEWLYRLGVEPRRLWRRYLIDYVPAALALLKDVRRS